MAVTSASLVTSLKGKTVFISGASRGIGLAIAKRCGQEGANVAIAAKTTEPHPKLPNTIYTAAAEVERAGGRALALKCDIRSDESVQAAVDATVAKFGGIDVLINNASAIWLRGCEATPPKRFDLMNQINARGTYVCTHYCLPHLRRSAEAGRNPHVLTLAPPLSTLQKWYAPHTAYTMAKMGMAMCVAGHSAEFKEYGIAVNALWPQTGIATAAIEFIAGDAASTCRTVDIMSDAAFHILTERSCDYTGWFCIDEDVLRKKGVVDFDHYAVTKGTRKEDLMPDFFLTKLNEPSVNAAKL